MILYKALQPIHFSKTLNVGFSAPSNIALVKYWGKYPVQLPTNSSISFTLNNCKTDTYIHISLLEEKAEDFKIDVFFEGKPKQSFEPKIQKFFERVEPYFSFLRHYHFNIDTSNTFPHSSGIASSASGFAAIASCLVKIEAMLARKTGELNLEKASFVARLGSGSASRSIEGPLMVWGKHDEIDNSSDEYAIAYDDIHPIFKDYQDVILLVDKGEKQVSSTVGHNLMNGHPYAKSRFEQAQKNLSNLLLALKSGDLNNFIEITENEALSLHAMMMSSQPYFILMKPETLNIINTIWSYRAKTKIPISFTLDAGANVHLLFPKTHKTKVLEFINTELIVYCQNEQYICDNVGSGINTLN